MSTTRNNHYVPQWYQEGFFERGRNTLAYLDMQPPQTVLDDGRVIVEKSLFDAPTSRAFRQLDLYSTFFGTSVNDEIERRLFGNMDTQGCESHQGLCRHGCQRVSTVTSRPCSNSSTFRKFAPPRASTG